MASGSSLTLQQLPVHGSAAGYWKLAPEQAFTVRPDAAGVLRVAHGQLWATLHGPHAGPANDWGDVVLRCGQEMTLLPGQQLVVEPFGDAVNEAAFFSWEPRQSAARIAADDASPWRDPLARPHLDIDGLVRPLMAAVRGLFPRLAAASSMLVAGRGRVLPLLECNQP